MGRGVEKRYGEVEDHGSRKAGCRERGAGLSFAGNVRRSSDSDSLSRVRACEIYSSANVPMAMTLMTSSMTWQENVTAKWDEYARTKLPRYVVPHQLGDGKQDGRVSY